MPRRTAPKPAAVAPPPVPESAPVPGEVEALREQVYWQLQHAGELVVALRDHRATTTLRGIPFRYGLSDAVPAGHPELRYFLERPSQYLVAPVESITIGGHEHPSLLEQENAALRERIAFLETALAAFTAPEPPKES